MDADVCLGEARGVRVRHVCVDGCSKLWMVAGNCGCSSKLWLEAVGAWCLGRVWMMGGAARAGDGWDGMAGDGWGQHGRVMGEMARVGYMWARMVE